MGSTSALALTFGFKDVAAAPDRVDQLGLASSVNLVAEIVDVYINDIREGVEIQTPDVFRDHGPREDATGVAHHVFKQRIFFGCQLDMLSAARDFTGGRVQHEILDLEQ